MIILIITTVLVILGGALLLIGMFKNNDDLKFAGCTIALVAAMFGYVILGLLAGVQQSIIKHPHADLIITQAANSTIVESRTSAFPTYVAETKAEFVVSGDSTCFLEEKHQENSYGMTLTIRYALKNTP